MILFIRDRCGARKATDNITEDGDKKYDVDDVKMR